MIKSTGIMRESGNNVPGGTVFMALDRETGQTALEIPDRKIGKSRGYSHYQEIALHEAKRERSGRATRRWPISRENIFFCLS